MTSDLQAKIDALVEDTRKQTALPSDACVIQSLATQVLLLRDVVHEFNRLAPDIAQLLDGWHCDTAWTPWDTSVRERLGALQKRTDPITPQTTQASGKAIEFPEPGSMAWIDREVERSIEKGD